MTVGPKMLAFGPISQSGPIRTGPNRLTPVCRSELSCTSAWPCQSQRGLGADLLIGQFS
jgi:hypothetical protein